MKGLSAAVACLCITFLATLVYVDLSIGLDVVVEILADCNTPTIDPDEIAHPQIVSEDIHLLSEISTPGGNAISEISSPNELPMDPDRCHELAIPGCDSNPSLDVILFEPQVDSHGMAWPCEEQELLDGSEPKKAFEQGSMFQEYRTVYENARTLLSNRALILPQMELAEFSDIFSVEIPMEDLTLLNISRINTTGRMTASGRAVAGVEVLAIHSERTKYEAKLTVVFSPPEIQQVYLDEVFRFRYDGSSLLTAAQRLDNANEAYTLCLEEFYSETRQRAIQDGILERCRGNAERFIREIESLSSQDFRLTVHLEWSDRESGIRQDRAVRLLEGSCQDFPSNPVKPARAKFDQGRVRRKW